MRLSTVGVRVVLRSDPQPRPTLQSKPLHLAHTQLPSQSSERKRRRSHSVNVPLIRHDVDGQCRVQPLQLTAFSARNANVHVVMDSTADDDDKVTCDAAG